MRRTPGGFGSVETGSGLFGRFQMNPVSFSFPLAAITIMLFLLWSDSVRRSRPGHPALYAGRALLFLLLGGVLLFNMLRYPELYDRGSRPLVIVAALIALGGAAFFLRRARKPRRPPLDELPTLGLERKEPRQTDERDGDHTGTG